MCYTCRQSTAGELPHNGEKMDKKTTRAPPAPVAAPSGAEVARKDLRASCRALLEYSHGVATILGQDPPFMAIVILALGVPVVGDCKARSVGELGQLAGLDLKTTSRILAELRAREWVKLATDPLDTRVKRVALTRKGDGILHLMLGAGENTAFRIVESIQA